MSSPSNLTGSRFLRHVGSILLISSLVACGGGGGGGSKSSPTPNPVNTSSSTAALSSSSSSVQSSSVSSVPVASAPTVDAGVAASVITGKTFEFAGTAAADEGKQLTSFLWEQIGNASVSVEIAGADQLAASFSAPYVSSDAVINFRLTVTDSEGLTASDTVTITISADPNAPVAGMKFPPAVGIYTNPLISVFGKASVKDDAYLSKITVSTSVNEVIAEVDSEGNWRANGLVLPVNTPGFTVTVRIEDSKGRIAIERSDLTSQVNASVGGGEPWSGSSRSIVYERNRNVVWVLLTGKIVGDVKIIPVNVNTGRRGASVMSRPVVASNMIFDSTSLNFLVVGKIVNEQATLHSVSRLTGEVKLLSGSDKGVGPDFYSGNAGLATVNNNIYVANNSSSRRDFSGVMEVSSSSGRRNVFLDEKNNAIYEYLSDISFDRLGREMILLANDDNHSPVIATNIRTKAARSINYNSSGIGTNGKFIVSGDYIYAVSDNNRLQRINLLDGRADTITSELPVSEAENAKQIAYDATNKLIYVAISNKGLYVVDEASGNLAGFSTR